MKCKTCEHNYDDIHCCVLRNMEDAKYSNCDGYMKKVIRPKPVFHNLNIEQEQEEEQEEVYSLKNIETKNRCDDCLKKECHFQGINNHLCLNYEV